MPVAPSAYYDAVARPVSRQTLRDEELRARITRVHQEDSSVYGARKMWLTLNRKGVAVAHCTVQRLMRELGMQALGTAPGGAPP